MSELITNYRSLKVADYLRRDQPKRVLLIFWHGLGDVVLFLDCLQRLREMFPEVKIDLALQFGTGQEELVPDAVMIGSPEVAMDNYDYTFQIHFPMSEHLVGVFTKQGFCCQEELGIDPVDSVPELSSLPSPLVACHFQATAMPGPCNPSIEVAEQIWREIIELGLVPIEVYFKHSWYNPVNEKMPFIGCSTREARASIISLIGIYQRCFASIAVASGNLPISLAIMPERTLYLEKDYKISSYTKMPIKSIHVENYSEGFVREWLKDMLL